MKIMYKTVLIAIETGSTNEVFVLTVRSQVSKLTAGNILVFFVIKNGLFLTSAFVVLTGRAYETTGIGFLIVQGSDTEL